MSHERFEAAKPSESHSAHAHIAQPTAQDFREINAAMAKQHQEYRNMLIHSNVLPDLQINIHDDKTTNKATHNEELAKILGEQHDTYDDWGKRHGSGNKDHRRDAYLEMRDGYRIVRMPDH